MTPPPHGRKPRLRRPPAKVKAGAHAAGGQEPRSSAATLKALHELQMRQVDLEAQNEELRATRHELERQQSQNAQLRHRLQNSQALLQEAGRMAKVGGWEFDVATRKQVWTEEIYHIHELPLSYQPTVSQGIAFYTAAARPIIERAVQRAIEHGEPFEVELDIITAKGNHRWVRTMGEARVE